MSAVLVTALFAPAVGRGKHISFSLTKPDKGFPKGKYVVKLLLDDEEKLTVPFTVE